MFRIHPRFETATLCEWHECRGCESPVHLGDVEAARIWLSGFLFDDPQAMELRLSAHRSGDGLGLATRGDHDVVDAMARMIGAGWLKVCVCDTVDMQDQAMAMETAPPASPAPPAAARPRSAPVAPPPSDDATLPVSTDTAAMIKTLVAAAADGVPFCEICEKAKQARSQPAEAAA